MSALKNVARSAFLLTTDYTDYADYTEAPMPYLRNPRNPWLRSVADEC
jgi:hypothetical protein